MVQLHSPQPLCLLLPPADEMRFRCTRHQMALPFSNEEIHTDPITPGILAQDQGSTTESWQGCRGEQWGVWGLWTNL